MVESDTVDRFSANRTNVTTLESQSYIMDYHIFRSDTNDRRVMFLFAVASCHIVVYSESYEEM